MSKFKIGDKVFLSPDSQWVARNSLDVSSANPLNMEGVIDEVDGSEYGIMWGNGRHNSCYEDCDLISAVVRQPIQECPYSVIEELECKIESLEQLVSEQAARIRELEAEYVQEQAKCYIRLNTLLTSHRSFQESNECRSNELANTVKLLQYVYDIVRVV